MCEVDVSHSDGCMVDSWLRLYKQVFIIIIIIIIFLKQAGHVQVEKNIVSPLLHVVTPQASCVGESMKSQYYDSNQQLVVQLNTIGLRDCPE